MFLVITVFSIIEYARFHASMMQNLTKMAACNSQLLEESLQSPLQPSDFNEVQNNLDLVGRNQKFNLIDLLNANGTVVLALNQANAGTQLDYHNQNCWLCHQLPPAQRPGGIVIRENKFT